jgi:hypothetical protein
MQKSDITDRLAELHEALEEIDKPDPSLIALLREVDEDIHEVLEKSPNDHEEGRLKERVEELGAEFAARYPHTERFFQELVATLGRLGI